MDNGVAHLVRNAGPWIGPKVASSKKAELRVLLVALIKSEGNRLYKNSGILGCQRGGSVC